MRQLQPVIWSKGTFLSPQHLQAQERFVEDSARFYLDSLNARSWGFREIQIDTKALSEGRLAITLASGIFPDALPLDIPASEYPPPARILDECFQDGRQSCTFYLAVPEYLHGGMNVSVDRGRVSTRFLAQLLMVRDENTGSGEKPVQVARKNLRLLVEGESRDGYSTLRVARVLRSETGTFQLDPSFVPPLVDFAANDHLVSMARRLVEILTARSSAISGLRRQKNQSLADFTAADIANFWLLYTVNTAFPVFRHLFETRRGHPEALYNAMLSLAGALSTFSTTIHPRDLPPYDHDNLGACFTDLDEKLRALLETVVPTNIVSLPLKLIQPAIYATSLDNEKYLVNTRMYLAVSAETSQAEIVGKTPQLVKVCSVSHIDHLVRQALPGVPLTYVAAPPSAIPVKLNHQYFSLNQSGPAWEAVQRSRNLAAYVPADLPNPQLELIILLPQAG